MKVYEDLEIEVIELGSFVDTIEQSLPKVPMDDSTNQ